MPRRSSKLKQQHKEFNGALLARAKARCRCGKIYSPTETDARKAEQFQAEKHQHQNPVRFYQCKYMGWHWTRSLYEVRQCRNCLGVFRPTNEEGDRDLCNTCETLLPQEPPTPEQTPPPSHKINASLTPSPSLLKRTTA